MNEYRYTFGMRYRNEPHPKAAWATPDGWLTIIAEDRAQADSLAYALTGGAYAFGYGPEEWAGPTHSGRTWTELYLLGCVARLELELKEKQ